MLKAVIFDMDGVIADTAKVSYQVHQELLNITLTPEDIAKSLGWAVPNKITYWAQQYNFDAPDWDEYRKQAQGAQVAAFIKHGSINPGVIDLITDLKNNNIKVALATSSWQSRADAILTAIHVKELFPVRVYAEDVKTHKPEPEVFLEAAKRLKINPEECVVIEDAQDGVKAAHAGGMKAVGKLHEYNSEEQLKQAELIVSDLTELSTETLQRLFD